MKCQLCLQALCQTHLPGPAHSGCKIVSSGVSSGQYCAEGKESALYAAKCRGELAQCPHCGQKFCTVHLPSSLHTHCIDGVARTASQESLPVLSSRPRSSSNQSDGSRPRSSSNHSEGEECYEGLCAAKSGSCGLCSGGTVKCSKCDRSICEAHRMEGMHLNCRRSSKSVANMASDALQWVRHLSPV